MSAADETAAAPAVRVVRGNPSDEELAALVTVLAAASSAAAPAEPPVVDTWGHPTRLHRDFRAFSPYAFGSGIARPPR